MHSVLSLLKYLIILALNLLVMLFETISTMHKIIEFEFEFNSLKNKLNLIKLQTENYVYSLVDYRQFSTEVHNKPDFWLEH